MIMDEKIGRNDPCYCGSGKKFKKCHFKKEIFEEADLKEKQRVEMLKHFNSVIKNTKPRLCFHPECFNKKTNNEAIKAHTLQRGKTLKLLAQNGMVYSLPESMYKARQPELKEVGIAGVTTFYGFCGEHDKKLFTCIEDNDFTGTPEQCFAFFYRNMSHEFYKKLTARNLFNKDFIKNFDCGLNHNATDEMINNDCMPLKKIYDQILLTKDYNKLCNKIITLDYEIGFASANVNNFNKDFNDNVLFDDKSKDPFPPISITIIPENGKSYIIMSTLQEYENYYKFFFDKLDSLNKDAQLKLLTGITLLHSENTVFSKRLLDKLDTDEKRKISYWFGKFSDSIKPALSCNLNLFIDCQTLQQKPETNEIAI